MPSSEVSIWLKILHTSIEKSKNVIAAEATPIADAGSILDICGGGGRLRRKGK
jgi:hypothetical protein